MSLTRDLDFGAYLALPGAHSSTLRAIDVSPLHYRRAVDHERGDTPALRLGRIVHAMVLTQDEPRIPDDVIAYSGKVRRGKEWEAFKAAHEGLTILTAGEYADRVAELDSVRRMRDAVFDHPHARELLHGGDPEVTATWEMGGVACKCRFDYLPRSAPFTEVKTTRMTRPRAFYNSGAALLYHAQLALYAAGLEANRARSDYLPHVVSIEKVNGPGKPDVAVHRIGYDTLEAGRRKVDTWLRVLRECERSGRWPGVDGGRVLDWKLPAWAIDDDADVPDIQIDEA